MGLRYVVLGAGRQGIACAYDLAFDDNIDEVVLTDFDMLKAEKAAAQVKDAVNRTPAGYLANGDLRARNFQVGDGRDGRQIASAIGDHVKKAFKIRHHRIDVTQHTQLKMFLKDFDVAVSAVPYFFNLDITRSCIDAQTHLVDMGGNTDIVFKQREYDDKARAAGVIVLPDCGVAPGMANILAADGINRMDSVDWVKVRVGGLPQEPRPPLNYQLFFSIHGLINEYVGKAVVLRDGEISEHPTLTELEALEFPDSNTPLEAFLTLGGLSTMPWTFRGKVRNMDYKTVRYPGHCAQIKAFDDLGFFSEEPLQMDDGVKVAPREMFIKLVEPRLTVDDNRDVVVVRVNVQGSAGEALYEIADYYDEITGFTAMMRCTAFPVAIVARMIGNGDITGRGVLPLETAVPTGRFIGELKKRNIPLQVKLPAEAGKP